MDPEKILRIIVLDYIAIRTSLDSLFIVERNNEEVRTEINDLFVHIEETLRYFQTSGYADSYTKSQKILVESMRRMFNRTADLGLGALELKSLISRITDTINAINQNPLPNTK